VAREELRLDAEATVCVAREELRLDAGSELRRARRNRKRSSNVSGF
jgi:hypothetical protein